MAQILIVDDDDIIAELASDILAGENHDCQWVVSGAEALALLLVRRPDVVLLDNDMPGMSGTQVLRQMRDSPRDCELPVIMLTSVNRIQDEEAALFNGAQDYLRKPFEPRTLVQKVAHILDTRPYRPRHRELDEVLQMGGGRFRRNGWPTPRSPI
ncbi:two-component system response regulator [Qipengyuania sp. MTN3-11]|uniref:response regulator n=1 Tax=Qipengyuania sp. MTN3-11 TaxID=3056557 RepID=UPI0036F4267A